MTEMTGQVVFVTDKGNVWASGSPSNTENIAWICSGCRRQNPWHLEICPDCQATKWKKIKAGEK